MKEARSKYIADVVPLSQADEPLTDEVRRILSRSEVRLAKDGTYHHSAYWFAIHHGVEKSTAATHVERYIDILKMRRATRGAMSFGYDYFSSFNSLAFGACLALDIKNYLKNELVKLKDPEERARIAEFLRKELRKVRRPFYYRAETLRRRALADDRRKITKLKTSAPLPDPEDFLDAWENRKRSKIDMLRLGMLMENIEVNVDNYVRFDEFGNIVGRNSGVRGWIRACVPELSPHYKTLMRYKATTNKLRQATGLKNTVSALTLLKKPQHKVVRMILEDPRATYASVMDVVDYFVSPKRVFDDAPTAKNITRKILTKKEKLRIAREKMRARKNAKEMQNKKSARAKKSAPTKTKALK